jgi:hypothetical protein
MTKPTGMVLRIDLSINNNIPAENILVLIFTSIYTFLINSSTIHDRYILHRAYLHSQLLKQHWYIAHYSQIGSI